MVDGNEIFTMEVAQIENNVVGLFERWIEKGAERFFWIDFGIFNFPYDSVNDAIGSFIFGSVGRGNKLYSFVEIKKIVNSILLMGL